MSKDEVFKAILETPNPLSPDQKKAVISKSKYLRIVAGAGTGKTETLTRRIAYLLLYEEEDPRSVVAFTFTERAAQSMKNRIYERVAQFKGEKACARLGEMYVGTIHGYCLRILEDYFGYGDHNVLDENEEMAFILRHGWSLGLGNNGRYSSNCQDFLKSINIVYDELIDRNKLEQKDEDFFRHFQRYEELLKKHRLLTFGRMVALTVEELERKPEILKGIKHLIVDEYQDINRAQEKLIHIIGQNASTFIVGDPRQSIYQWRGSDETCFENFLKFKPEPVAITENRRSLKSIVRVANTFAETFKKKYESLDATKGEEGAVVLVECDTNQSEAEWVASQIQHLVKEEKRCNFSDISILLRSVTTSGKPFLEAFGKYGFPFLVGGKVGLFKRDEAQVVGRLFAWFGNGFWVEDPYKWRDKLEGGELLDSAIAKWKVVCGNNIGGLQKKLESLKMDILNEEFNDFTGIYQELLVILGFTDLDPSDKLQAAIMANLGRFNNLLTDYESSIRRGGAKPDWPNALKGLNWFMNTYASGAYEEQPAEDLRGVDALQIMTIHQAKGLEWPVVFLPCLVSRRFPSGNIGREQNWYVPRSLFDVKRYEGDIEDEKRLFYVAMTRAKDMLCMSFFNRISKSVGPSKLLEPIWNNTKQITENDMLPPVDIKGIIEEDEMQTFSAGEIITYLRCPYLYRLSQIWGYQPELAPELGYGKSLHHCLRHASELIKQGEAPAEAIRKVIADKFHLPYAGGKQKETMLKAAEKILVEFVRRHENDMLHIEEVESRLEFPVEKATITGKVDVIIKDAVNPVLEVRDYKTSDDVTTLEDSTLQVRLYSLGLKSIGRPVAQASVAYLKEMKNGKKDIEYPSVSDSELQIAKQQAENCIKGVIKGDFHAKCGEHCNGACEYPKICRWNAT